jgi:hypothetical protein
LEGHSTLYSAGDYQPGLYRKGDYGKPDPDRNFTVETSVPLMAPLALTSSRKFAALTGNPDCSFVLFLRQMEEITHVGIVTSQTEIEHAGWHSIRGKDVPPDVILYRIEGPMFLPLPKN